MTPNGQLVAQSPADELLARLDEPRVAAALGNLLDHADLLAILVVGLDGLVSRGEVIGASLADAIGELRGGAEDLPSVDLKGLASSVATLSGSLSSATPALDALLRSSLTDPKAVEVISQLAHALVVGRERIDTDRSVPTGVFGLLRALKDDDVSRGLGYLMQVAKAFGQQLDASH
ncbi:protein of unknown function DUF1641 [Pseudonocardia dioxanivorans CB1190]|uniref:DUF1641 domain-containing protein n=1 Tax=Pseudonocardia dioxanivorans (strain ATCC 55486 / DSM 44775 / JCM 13855 / CB1190) TaxID=675635 RepID=F4CS12_PSEUX|nr:DUF1641 domain-containing protein [Pseudonocardia dioxanivorans]AEA28456.1 protein of unknown function DUF1641 [Pseudonocardia dioxanivorans CB1190]